MHVNDIFIEKWISLEKFIVKYSLKNKKRINFAALLFSNYYFEQDEKAFFCFCRFNRYISL